MTKHTPAPWTKKPDGRVEDKHGRVISSCRWASTDPVQSEELWFESEANAQLIANAPLMLEALKKLAEWDESDGDAYLISQACSMARAAIQEATK